MSIEAPSGVVALSSTATGGSFTGAYVDRDGRAVGQGRVIGGGVIEGVGAAVLRVRDVVDGSVRVDRGRPVRAGP